MKGFFYTFNTNNISFFYKRQLVRYKIRFGRIVIGIYLANIFLEDLQTNFSYKNLFENVNIEKKNSRFNFVEL